MSASEAKKNGDSKKQGGARPVANKPESAMSHYFSQHRKALGRVGQQILHAPVSSLFTSSVIGVALVFPVLLVLVLYNLSGIHYDWKGAAQISLFLKQGVPELDASALADDIRNRDNIESVQFISNRQALEDLKGRYDFDQVLDGLDDNPLPHLILITPAESLIALEQLQAMAEQLEQIPEVDKAHLDAIWVERLRNIVAFVERILWVVSLLFGAAVLVIIGNTIRLAIEGRREEIVVVKLVGGTDAFVCRPFLYLGMTLGLVGGVLAAMVVQGVVLMLTEPIAELVHSYQGEYALSGLGFVSTLLVLFTGGLLGWLGAWLAVRRHLREVEPD